MADKLGVYNGALLHLGSEPMVALTEDGPKRRKLDAAWDSVVKWCLEQAIWNHALRSAKVDASPSLATSFGYSFVFEKPNDWIRTGAISTDEYGRVPLLEYEDRTDFWLADVDPLYVWWVSNDPDYGLDLGRWPETFTTFVEYALAHKACKAITGSSEGRDALKKEMIRAKRDAANKDAMNNPATKFPPTGRLVASRGGSRSREGRYRAG
jgi:hypothetical protein